MGTVSDFVQQEIRRRQDVGPELDPIATAVATLFAGVYDVVVWIGAARCNPPDDPWGRTGFRMIWSPPCVPVPGQRCVVRDVEVTHAES